MGGLNTQTGEYTCPGCGESLDLLPTDASAYVPVAEVIHVGCPEANHDDGNHHAALDHGDVVQAFASLGAGTPPDPTPGTFGLPADQWRIDPATWKPVVIVEGDLNVGAGYQLVGQPGGLQIPAAPAGGTAGGTAAPTGTPAGGTAGGTATPTGTPAGDTGTTSAPIPPIAVPLPAPDPNAAVTAASQAAPDTTATPPAPAAAPDTGTAEPVPFGGNMTALPVAPQPPGAPAASPDTGTDTGTGTGTPGAVPPATGA